MQFPGKDPLKPFLHGRNERPEILTRTKMPCSPVNHARNLKAFPPIPRKPNRGDRPGYEGKSSLYWITPY